jgi:phage shock protein PspC (stress-responsive transcriptional regulator)
MQMRISYSKFKHKLKHLEMIILKINIHRSATNKVFAGVLGGLSEHFQWNPTLARVIFVILAFTPFFPGIIAYLILWILMKDPA